MSHNSNYKRMFVLNEDEYKEFKRFKSTSTTTTAKCPKCGREFPNENILAHHLKSHVDGFKCNICGKVFESKTSLTIHLKNHALQVQPSKHSVLDNSMPNQTMSLADSTPSIPQSKPVAPKKPHKHKSIINFSVNKWLTLK